MVAAAALAIEIKRSLSPRLGKGFHQARADLQPERTFVVTPVVMGYPLADGVEVVMPSPETSGRPQAQHQTIF